jgi:hypothetical protein
MHEPLSVGIISQMTGPPIGAMLALLRQNGSSTPVSPENLTLLELITFTATIAPCVHDTSDMLIIVKAIDSGGANCLKASDPQRV